MEIGRRIYYDKATGNIVQDTGERSGDVVETTVEHDFESYYALNERVSDTVGHVELDYGYKSDSFMKYPYHVDITKNTIDADAIIFDTANPYLR